jgi:hypothetical protein
MPNNNPPIKINENRPDPPPGTSLAKGFGRYTSQINKDLNKARVAINNFYYGKSDISTNKKLQNPLDYGLINLLNLLASIDLCNVFSYSINKLPSAKKFNPDEKPSTTLGYNKYRIQYAAYEIQILIDTYYTNYQDPDSPLSKTALGSIVVQIKQFFSTILDSETNNPFKDPELRAAFPSISIMENYLQNVNKQLYKYTDVRNLKNDDIQKLIKYIDKIREVCIAVQSLDNPVNLISFADTYFGSDIGKDIQKLDKIIDPKRIIPTIKKIVNTAEKLKHTAEQILRYVQIGRTIIFVSTILIKIFKVISAFLSGMPVPSIFGTISVHVITARANEKMQYWMDYFLKRLSEINSVLNNIYYVSQDVSIKIGNLIDLTNLVTINLQNCNELNTSPIAGTVPPITGDIIPSLQSLVNDLQNTKNNLDAFVKNYDNNKKKVDNKYGDYTIEIITEQIVDPAINLKRRYGIALDINQIIVVETTPTFASDDRIIIEEVKLLLESKKLVPASKTKLSANEISILNESLNYLDSQDIDQQTSLDMLDSLNYDMGLDDPENENDEQEDSLNINAFVSKLKGGKRLRRRMRKQMAKAKLKLAKDLQNSDPQGKFSSGLVKRQKIASLKEAIKAENDLIRALKEEIDALKVRLPLLPGLIVSIKQKYKQIDDSQKKIVDFNKQISQIK